MTKYKDLRCLHCGKDLEAFRKENIKFCPYCEKKIIWEPFLQVEIKVENDQFNLSKEPIVLSSDEDCASALTASNPKKSLNSSTLPLLNIGMAQAIENQKRAGIKDAAKLVKKEGISGFSKAGNRRLTVRLYTQDLITRTSKGWASQTMSFRPTETVKDFGEFAAKTLNLMEEWEGIKEILSEDYELVGRPYWGLPAGKNDASRLMLPTTGTVTNILT